jgi:hypothetical protein
MIDDGISAGSKAGVLESAEGAGRQSTRQTRRSAPLLPVLLGTAAAILSWHTRNARSAGQPVPPSTNQTSSSGPSANLPTVTIEAKQELERQVNRFVTSEVFQAQGESIMRWNKAICPSVIGLPRLFNDYIQAQILDIARAANAPIGGSTAK